LSLRCVQYQPRTGDSLRGVVTLELQVPDVGVIEIKDFTLYELDGNLFVNPPVAKYSDGVRNFIRIRDRAHREKFRAAVLAAVEEFTKTVESN
jgi:hypothetical protein